MFSLGHLPSPVLAPAQSMCFGDPEVTSESPLAVTSKKADFCLVRR
jgi:hypothetical protein